MMTVSIASCLTGQVPVDTVVTLQGWVRTRRDSKAGFSFIQLYDGSCFNSIQLIASKECSNYENEILRITAGCALVAKGRLVASPGKGQSYEVQADEIAVLGWVDDAEAYPITPKHHSFEYLRDVAHLRPRTNTFGAITRVRHTAAQTIHNFFHERGFYWLNTPIITTNDCEGAGEQFRVSHLDLMNLPRNAHNQIDFSEDFFGTETFLTVSGQLNAEAYALALSKVYTFGPTFRAENSNTSRHLAEFWMVEPEIAFANLENIIDLAEAMLKTVFTSVLEKNDDDMKFFNQRIEKTTLDRLKQCVQKEFVHLDYADAIAVLEKAGRNFEFPVAWGLELHTEHERYLTEEYVKGPVVVVNYPKETKAFYMRINDDGKTVAAMDVLVPGVGEIIGGSQREERLPVLEQRMLDMDLNPRAYDWYLDLRRYGSVPHGGYGLGFERLISYITGMANVRDVIPFPRVPNYARF